MSSKHSAEFKATIALEAMSSSAEELEALAKKHGITVTEIQNWITELKGNASSLFSDDTAGGDHHHAVGEDVTYETDDEELYEYVQHGAQADKLNYKKLFFWTTFGTALVVVMIVILVQFAQSALFKAQEQALVNSQYPEITELKAQEEKTLNSFGVVDAENGIYRIPIDSAISKMAAE